MSYRMQDSELPELASSLLTYALEAGYAKGRSGWQDANCTEENLQVLCEQAVADGEWHKVICYAAMIAGKKVQEMKA